MNAPVVKFGDAESIRPRNYMAGGRNGVPATHRITSPWRLESRYVISKVLSDNSGADWETLRSAIYAAYPFGQRKYTPYKIWLQEVKAALASLDGKA